MKKIVFTYNKKTGDIISKSDSFNNFEDKNIEQVEIDLTDDELGKVKKNYRLSIKDEKLVTIKPRGLVFLDIKDELEKAASVEDLKSIIKKVVNIKKSKKDN